MSNQFSKPLIFVINLKKSVERRGEITSQFEKLQANIDFQFFEGINGKENPDFYLFKKYNESKRLIRKGSCLNLSQLGCFASHYLLWEKAIELNQPIIILEDDAILQSNFSDIYHFCNSKDNNFEFFFLSPPAKKGGKESFVFQIDNNNKVLRRYKGYANATGYYITPAAATKLLSYSQEWIYEVDITMDRWYENNLNYLGIEPPCVRPNFSLESNIPVDKGRKQRTWFTRLRREYFNAIDNLKIFLNSK